MSTHTLSLSLSLSVVVVVLVVVIVVIVVVAAVAGAAAAAGCGCAATGCYPDGCLFACVSASVCSPIRWPFLFVKLLLIASGSLSIGVFMVALQLHLPYVLHRDNMKMYTNTYTYS